MALFSYKDFDEKALIDDISALNSYCFDVFSGGAQNGFAAYADRLGWKVLTGKDIGYNGLSGPDAEFLGETLLLLTTQANVFGKYNAEGKLISVGINFWGTGGRPDVDDSLFNLIADGLVDIGVALGEAGIANDYITAAYSQLFTSVAEFARANGLTGKDVIITGHSMGGMAVNSMAAGSSLGAWDGFYEVSAYVAWASPTQNQLDDKVFNYGLENDPVYRVLEGDSLTNDSLIVHDKPLETCVNNVVAFNDHFVTNEFYSLLNLNYWANGHAGNWYVDTADRILTSSFYNITQRDSTVIVSHLSDEMRETTWVEDLNYCANPHYGPTFILGTDKDDMLAGGKGMDYLEGGAGNDLFRDAGGYNAIFGGEGVDTYDIQGSINSHSFAQDAYGNLYVKNPDGGISVLNSVEQIKDNYFSWFNWHEATYTVTSEGLVSGDSITKYAATYSADLKKDSTVEADDIWWDFGTNWLFGYEGNDTLHGSKQSDVFVAAEGNDVMYSNGGQDTFMFMGEAFGHDTIYGFDSDDKLVFLGNSVMNGDSNYLDFLTANGDDVVFNFNDECSITLVGTSLDQLSESQFALA